MESKEVGNNPLEVGELIRQAQAQQKKWKKPNNEPKLTHREWQEILDNRRAPSGM